MAALQKVPAVQSKGVTSSRAEDVEVEVIYVFVQLVFLK